LTAAARRVREAVVVRKPWVRANCNRPGPVHHALSHYEAVPPTVQQTLMGQYWVHEDE